MTAVLFEVGVACFLHITANAESPPSLFWVPRWGSVFSWSRGRSYSLRTTATETICTSPSHRPSCPGRSAICWCCFQSRWALPALLRTRSWSTTISDYVLGSGARIKGRSDLLRTSSNRERTLRWSSPMTCCRWNPTLQCSALLLSFNGCVLRCCSFWQKESWFW